MKNHKGILLLSFFIVSALFFVYTPSCKGEKEHRTFSLSLDVSITQVNLENHTVLANVDFEFTGVPSLKIDDVQQVPETMNVIFSNIDLFEVHCNLSSNLGNGTYTYSGDLQGRYWNLYSFGQLYPFDYGYVYMYLYPSHLYFSINGSMYSPEPEWSYSFNIVKEQVSFYGPSNVNLQNTWRIVPTLQSDKLQIRLERNETNPQYLIIIPLLWFLTLVAILPLFLSSKNMRLQFYLSLLVFAPLFIFAIQGFIPPRDSLSIPEFLSFALVLASTVMIVFSLASKGSEKVRCYLDIGGLMFSLSFIYFLGYVLYVGFFDLTASGLAVSGVILYLTVTFGASAIVRVREYDSSEKRRMAERERRFEEYSPEDFAH